jgi:chromosome segregation ATPase
MAEDVTLLDLSFKTEKAVEGLDALIKKSLELAEEKKQLTTTLNNEKKALEEVRKAYADNKTDQTAAKKQMEQLETNIISNTKKLNDMKTAVSENAA